MRYLLAFTLLLSLALSNPAQADQNATPPTSKPGTQQPPESPLRHLETAERLSQEKRFKEAVVEYRLFLKSNPDQEAAHFGLAFALSQIGDEAAAIDAYLSALRINPSLWQAELNLGLIYLNQQKPADALFHLERARILQPTSFNTQLFCSRAQEALGKLSESESGYLAARELAKTEGEKYEAHASLALLYAKQKAIDKLQSQLETIQALKSPDPRALYLDLAGILYRHDDFEAALSVLNRLPSDFAQDPELQELRGRLLLRLQDFEKALAAFKSALALQDQPKRRESLWLLMADANRQLERPEEVLACLQQAAGTSQDPDLHFQLATEYLKRRQFDPAAREFLTTLKLQPERSECYSNLGTVFMLQENYPLAISALSKFKELRPDVPGTYFYLGLAFDKLADAENAYAHYQRFLELDAGKSDKQTFQATERMKVLARKLKRRN
ncbi:MAG: tetratricopeptide repeat protein [Acidobacteriota bacterium]